jgi:hypothetical protein
VPAKSGGDPGADLTFVWRSAAPQATEARVFDVWRYGGAAWNCCSDNTHFVAWGILSESSIARVSVPVSGTFLSISPHDGLFGRHSHGRVVLMWPRHVGTLCSQVQTSSAKEKPM